MDGYLSNKPDNFVDDPEKLYRLRRREAHQDKKLNFVVSKSEDEGSLESPKNSPPQSPRENRVPPMGEQPPQERKIGELCTVDIVDLPILNLVEIGRLFEIKTSTIHMVQHSPFAGKEDPNLHLQVFIQLCQTFNMDGVTQDQMRARLFAFSLLGKALQLFHSQPAETVQNWNVLMRAFMKEYYSPGITQSLHHKIATFAQYPTETISEAFERLNEYTLAVPHHKFPKEDLMQKFYQGLTMALRTIIDASAGGSIIELTPTEAFSLFKKVANIDTWVSSGHLLLIQPTGNVKGVLQVEKENYLACKIDSLMRRLEKMEIEKKEAQDLKAAEARSTCEECGEYGHAHKDCPEEAKVLDYMRKRDLPNFPYGQGRPQFNASSFILNSVPLRIQLKDFMDGQAKINKDTVTKFKAMDKVLVNIDSKVTEVGSSNHQVLNMMKMLETQVGQLAGRLTTNEGKLPGQPKGPETAKATQTHSGKETEDPECSAGAKKPKPSVDVEEFAKEEVIEIVTEEPEFEMPG
jgi:ribosomal protein L32